MGSGLHPASIARVSARPHPAPALAAPAGRAATSENAGEAAMSLSTTRFDRRGSVVAGSTPAKSQPLWSTAGRRQCALAVAVLQMPKPYASRLPSGGDRHTSLSVTNQLLFRARSQVSRVTESCIVNPGVQIFAAFRPTCGQHRTRVDLVFAGFLPQQQRGASRFVLRAATSNPAPERGVSFFAGWSHEPPRPSSVGNAPDLSS